MRARHGNDTGKRVHGFRILLSKYSHDAHFYGVSGELLVSVSISTQPNSSLHCLCHALLRKHAQKDQRKVS